MLDINSDKKACTERRYTITKADLPISCPPQEDRIWDAHPRVYLPVADVGEYRCPYCSAVYVLTDWTPTEK